LDKRKIIIGSMIALLGVVLTKIRSIPFIDIRRIIIYIIGIIIGLIGLSIIASGLSKRTIKMKICPSCSTLNSIEAVKCFKCSRELK